LASLTGNEGFAVIGSARKLEGGSGEEHDGRARATGAARPAAAGTASTALATVTAVAVPEQAGG
jgi:hypothetical protein